MPDTSSESDYGSEIDWADSAVDAALQQFERAGSFNRAGPTAGEGRSDSTAGVAEHVVDVEYERNDDSTVEPNELRSESAVQRRPVAEATTPSLWERYRKRRGWGALSVSDLSSPSWCEVQHTYRLASKPFLPPLERPATITTAAGSIIQVDSQRTVRRESILDGGKAVHRKIEKQVMGDVEQVKVDVSGKEEWWALRILNTLVCLETLLSSGRVRELPVVGWLGDHLVFGVVDEVERRNLPSTSEPAVSTEKQDNKRRKAPSPSKSPRKKGGGGKAADGTDDSAQRKLDQFFSILRSPAKATSADPPTPPIACSGSASTSTTATSSIERQEEVEAAGRFDSVKSSRPVPGRFTFVLSDTKTRYNRSIPPAAESRPARLQLMLYHRLLASLLVREAQHHTSSGNGGTRTIVGFSWTRLYAHLGLAPDQPLSEEFLASIEPVIADSRLEDRLCEGRSLAQFVEVLAVYGDLLRRPDQSVPLSDELEISYRLRSDSARSYKGRRGKKTAVHAGPARAEPLPEAGEPDLGSGEAASIDEDADLQRAIALSLENTHADGAPAPSDPAREDAGLAIEPDGPESQQEDSQLPFFANPSLPISLSSPPPTQLDLSLETDTVDPLGPFVLPQNSQSHPTESSEPPTLAASLRPRYQLRRRSRQKSDLTSDGSPQEEATAAGATVPPPSPPPSPPPRPKRPPLAQSDLIGTTKFQSDPDELERWITNVLAYWTGARSPEGVSLAQVNRCRSCEFEEDCEWRAAKAAEVANAAKERRLARGLAEEASVGERGLPAAAKSRTF